MLGRKSFLMVMVHLVSFVMAYVALYFVAHLMGVVAVGIIGYALSFVNLFSFFAGLGFGTAHLKKVSEGADLATCIGTYYRIRRALLLIFIGAVLLAMSVDIHIIGTAYTEEMYMVMLLIIGSVAFHQYSGIYLHTFAGLRETARMEVPNLLSAVTQSLGRIVVALTGLGLVFLAGAYFLGGFVIMLAAFFLFRDKPVGAYDQALAKEYLLFAIPAAVPVMLHVITVNIDKLMVGWFWSMEEVGYYVASEHIAFFFLPLSIAVRTLLLPSFSELSLKGKRERIGALLYKAERYLSLLGIPIMLGFMLFSRQIILFLLGAEFEPAVFTFMILSVVAYVLLLNRVYNSLVMGLDRPDISARLWIAMAALNVVLNLIFIPEEFMGIPMLGMGAAGSAISTLIVMLLALCVYQYLVVRMAGGRSLRSLGVQLLSGLLLFLCFTLLFDLTGLPMDHAASVMGATLVIPLWIGYEFAFVASYFGVLATVGEFTRRDVRYFFSAVNPKEMKKYIRDEIRSRKGRGRPGGKE